MKCSLIGGPITNFRCYYAKISVIFGIFFCFILYDKVYVGSNVLPDNENPDNMTDVLTVACVLAHEYYGHRSMRDKYINETEDSSMMPLDEFNASFFAYKTTPNLTDEERMMLLEHAYEIAKDGNLAKEIEICKNIKKKVYENEEVRKPTYGIHI